MRRTSQYSNFPLYILRTDRGLASFSADLYPLIDRISREGTDSESLGSQEGNSIAVIGAFETIGPKMAQIIPLGRRWSIVGTVLANLTEKNQIRLTISANLGNFFASMGLKGRSCVYLPSFIAIQIYSI